MPKFQQESLVNDAVHGYIPFISVHGIGENEIAEQQLIDHPWVQRLRQIHQLQTAWWVFPSAEHTRFQHVLGAMHMAGRMGDLLYPSLAEVIDDEPLPSREYVISLLRIAALLHDVGHGPFGHFFDEFFLKDFGLTHETLGCEIIRRELADQIRGIRRSPYGIMAEGEAIDPEQIATLITRPRAESDAQLPRWLRFLRSLFCGLYTVDNMDFVLRDAYMSGFSSRSFDLDRLLHYTFFSKRGLTIHERGLSALVRFIAVRGELFQAIYFHRTVRAIDLELQELFRESRRHLFAGSPLDHLDLYQKFTEWSLTVRVGDWPSSPDPEIARLGQRWQKLLRHQFDWKMACQRTIFFRPGEPERSSVFSNKQTFEGAVRAHLPPELSDIPIRVDTARHVHRPSASAATAGQNYLLDMANQEIRQLDDRELFRQLPVSCRICRVYSLDPVYFGPIARAMDQLVGDRSDDDLTNM
jgi:uncharacterized protein